MRIVISIALLLGPVSAMGVLGCSGPVSGADSFRLSIRDSSAPADLAWQNHLAFLYYFNVVPREVEIDIPAARLVFGHQKTQADFISSVDRVANFPAGNLILRCYANWAKKLARDLNQPARAGEFFLGMINRRGLRFYQSDGTVQIGSDEKIGNLIQKMSFDSTPGLAEMEMLIDSNLAETVDRCMLRLFYISLRFLSPIWRPGPSSPRKIVEDNLLASLRALEMPHTPLRATSEREQFRLSFEPPGQGVHRGDFIFRAHSPRLGYFLLPSMGDNLEDLIGQRGALVKIDGEEIVAFLPISLDASLKFYDDFIFLERLLFPQLLEWGVFQNAVNVYQAVTGLPANHLPNPQTGPRPEQTPDLAAHPERLRERAIAYALIGAYELGKLQPTRMIQDMMLRIMARDPEEAATYATFERIARKEYLPIHVVARGRRDLSAAVLFRWPPYPRFENRTYRPTHAAMIYIRHHRDSAALHHELSVDPEENLRLLELYSGGAVLDTSRN